MTHYLLGTVIKGHRVVFIMFVVLSKNRKIEILKPFIDFHTVLILLDSHLRDRIINGALKGIDGNDYIRRKNR